MGKIKTKYKNKTSKRAYFMKTLTNGYYCFIKENCETGIVYIYKTRIL